MKKKRKLIYIIFPVILLIVVLALNMIRPNIVGADEVQEGELGLLVVTRTTYNGSYDGKPHGILIECDGATIKYGTQEGVYNLDASPTYVDSGTYKVYFKATKPGYTDAVGYETINIGKLIGSLELSETGATMVYPETKIIDIINNTSGGKVSARSSDTQIATVTLEGESAIVVLGTKEGSATITLDVEETRNYTAATVTYNVVSENGTIDLYSEGYEGYYDGQAHGVFVDYAEEYVKYGRQEGTYNLDDNPTFTDSGTYEVYFRVNEPGYKTVNGHETVKIKKAKYNITLPDEETTLKQGDVREFEISNPSGGTLSASSTDSEIADVRVEGSSVIIEGGSNSGTVTITIKISETENFEEIIATHTVNNESDKYRVIEEEHLITRIPPWTKLEDMKQYFVTTQSYRIFKLNSEELKNGEYVGTKMVLRLENGVEYTLIVIGDLNNDGIVTSTDLIKLKRHIVGLNRLDNYQVMAADVNDDGKTTSTDLIKEKRILVGLPY